MRERERDGEKGWEQIRRTYTRAHPTLRDLRFNDRDRRERGEAERFLGDE